MEADYQQLKSVEEYKYSPAYITKLLLHHRDNPHDALLNIDKFNEDIEIKPLYENRDCDKRDIEEKDIPSDFNINMFSSNMDFGLIYKENLNYPKISEKQVVHDSWMIE